MNGLLDSAAEGPHGLVLEGEPGIGKTALWETGILGARAHGMHVLVARCRGSESRFSFVALGDLFEELELPLGAISPGSPADIEQTAHLVFTVKNSRIVHMHGVVGFDWKEVFSGCPNFTAETIGGGTVDASPQFGIDPEFYPRWTGNGRYVTPEPSAPPAGVTSKHDARERLQHAKPDRSGDVPTRSSLSQPCETAGVGASWDESIQDCSP